MSEALHWKQYGKVYFWRYRGNSRNYPGWHMTADAEGCRSLLALLDQFAVARYSCDQSIDLSRPDSRVLAVPNSPNKASPRERLRLRLPVKTPEHAWDLNADEKTVTLLPGREKLREMREGVSGRSWFPSPKSRTRRNCVPCFRNTQTRKMGHVEINYVPPPQGVQNPVIPGFE